MRRAPRYSPSDRLRIAWDYLWHGRSAKFAAIPLRDPALVAMFGGRDTEAGEDITERTALNISAVWAATNLISTSAAAFPLIPFESEDKEGRHLAKDTPEWDVLVEQPNPEMTTMAMRESMTAHALTWGNGFAEIEWDGPGKNFPLALWPITPDRVEVLRDPQTKRIVYEVRNVDESGRPVDDSKDVERFDPEDMIHLAGLGFDGVKGYPVVQLAREGLGLSMATERFGAAFFGRGSTPGGVIEHPGDLTPEATATLRESWEHLHRGPGNQHRVAILDEGMKWRQIGLPPDVAQFLQTRLFQVVEVARWFNIPPHLLRDLTHATYSNIENESLMFLIYTLRPWLRRWELEVKRKLFRGPRGKRFFVEHNVSDLLKADIKTRYEAYRQGREGGWLTLNDILRAEGMDTIESIEGGARLVPANMNLLGSHVTKQVHEAAQVGKDTFQIENTALSGVQTQALREIMEAVAANKLAAQTAKHMILIAFPKVPEPQVDELVAPYMKKGV